MLLSFGPAFPRALVGPDGELFGVPNQGNFQEQRLLGELLEPAIVRKLRIAKSEFTKLFGIFVNKRHYAKFLRKSPQFPERCRFLHQVNEMSPDSSFREKAKSFTGVRAFSDTKDLYFQDWPVHVFPGMCSRVPSILPLSIDGA
jgi:hypothetical protein